MLGRFHIFPIARLATFGSVLSALSVLSACSSSSSAPVSSASPTDTGASDVGDAGPSCSFDPPKVGATPETATLAGAAAHCGIPAFAWSGATSLGDVKQKGLHDHQPADPAAVLFAAVHVTPKQPLHEVDLEQIRYVTQDRGKPIEATALIAYPSDLDGKTQLDVVLLLHGTAGFEDGCAPSNTADARPLVAALASLGYVAVAPDYIGLAGIGDKTGFLHPYLVGQPTAIASLDAVRAARKLLATENGAACASTRFATLGGSQGGHAALWVDRLAPYYAQELVHVGVVATVPPADMLGEVTRALLAKVPASANTAAFYGAASDWYGARSKLGEVFVAPLDTQVPTELGTTCDPGASFKDKELNAVFTKTLLDAAATDGLRALSPWGCMLVENGLTTTSVKRIAPTFPGYGVLWVLGESDTLVNPPLEEAAFDALCGQGMQMQFVECSGATHTKATSWALPEIVDFLADRFAGKTMDAKTVCKRAAAGKCRGTP